MCLVKGVLYGYSYYSNQFNEIILTLIDHLILQEMRKPNQMVAIVWIHDSIWN